MLSLGFFYDFRPVGQGLFSVGRLSRLDAGSSPKHFTWVYDCGTENLPSTAFDNELTSLVGILVDGNLDLLIISHFDNDHISGLVNLLARCRVQRLVIPYLAPAERLLILLETPGPSANLQGFLAGPVEFIRSQEGGAGVEIIFVDGPSADPTSADFGGDYDPDSPVFLKARPPSREQDAADPDLGNADRVSQARIMDETIPLMIWGAWEFCFYNLPPEEVNRKVKIAELWAAVETDFREFHRNGGVQAGLIEKMRKSYRTVFGESGRQRNDISLVTYTGPVKRNLTFQGMAEAPPGALYLAGGASRPAACYPLNTSNSYFIWTKGIGLHAPIGNSKPSLLYTGDITLTDTRTREIKRLLTDYRWDSIQVLQVPHHGAESSWDISSDALGVLTHGYSVFSSARYRPKYLHPRDSVLEALAKTTRVLVNEYTGAVFHGRANWG